MASEIFFGLKELGYYYWLDVKMGKCKVAVMAEGVRGSEHFLAIVRTTGIRTSRTSAAGCAARRPHLTADRRVTRVLCEHDCGPDRSP